MLGVQKLMVSCGAWLCVLLKIFEEVLENTYDLSVDITF